ncbi:MAG TPA: hypothetical protein VF320_05090, partial [Acidimicrobiales bacterium]
MARSVEAVAAGDRGHYDKIMRPSLHGRLGAPLRRAAAISARARETGAPVDEVAERLAAGETDPEARFDRR